MSAALDRATALLADANVKAFLRVIREGESNQTDDAYRMGYGGQLHPPNVHPWLGRTTTAVGHSTAYGAYQFLGTSAREALDALGLGEKFSPINQDLCAVWTIDAKRHAAGAVQDGNLELACSKLRDEWVSLPGLGLQRAQRVFEEHGGRVSTEPAAPIDEAGQPAAPEQPQGKPMDPLTLISIFGPVLAQLIPQVGTLFGGKKDQQNVQAIATVLDTVVKATGQVGPADVGTVGTAVQAMQADKKVQAAVTQAVVTHPDIIGALQIQEVGGGAAAARESDLKVIASDVPFYKNSAVFWISMLLVPMVYWYVGSSVVGGIVIPAEWPWYAQLPLKMFGTVWDAGARVGLANLIVGLVLGGICGVYYGVSVTQAKQQQQQQAQSDSKA